jgi:HSP20 family protein
MTFVKLNNQPLAKSIQGNFGDLFNDFEQTFQSLLQTSGVAQSVPVNIVETAEGYHLELLAPGRVKEQFSILVENQQLVISYKVADQEKQELKHVRKEFTIGQFRRSFNLSDAVNTNDIQAKYEAGVLKVYLPKKEEAKPVNKQITIS